MPPKIILFVRTNIDWKNLDLDAFSSMNSGTDEARSIAVNVRAKMSTAIEQWESSFDFSFFEYRQRLKEIAEANWARLDRVHAIIKGDSMLPVIWDMDDSIVIPVDDDDWFAPELSTRLLERESQLESRFESPPVYRWEFGQFDVVGADKKGRPKWDHHQEETPFGTNGYALSSLALSALGPPSQRRALVTHFAAHRLLEPLNHTIVNLPEILSVSFKTFGSQMVLRRFSHDQLQARALELATQRLFVPAAIRWAKDSLQALHQLNRQLARSHRKTSVKR